MKKLIPVLAIVVVTFTIHACSRSETPPATAEPAFLTGTALVDSLEVLILESMPVGVRVIARGNLPDGCTSIDNVSVTREGNTFSGLISTIRPADAACAEILISFERVIPLDVVGLPAGTYTVRINDAESTFELLVDNVAATEPPPDDASASIRGLVWHDLCAVAVGTDSSPETVSEGCVEAPSGGYRANGLRDADEPGLGGVIVALGAGGCPASEAATAVTTTDGNYSFSGLTAGTYCVSVSPQDPQNAPLLVPGQWTTPDETGAVEMDLGIGDARANVNFGWDYQFLPTLNVEGCIDQAEFVADITVPDDALVLPGAALTKTWRLRNAGTCTWGPGYFLVFVSGARMGGEAASLPVVQPGDEVDISVALTAPEEAGTYRADWQLQNADRDFFGFGSEFEQTVFLRIDVNAAAPVGSTIRGLVWADRCVMLDEDTPSEGCVSDGAGGFIANGRLGVDEPGIPDVQVDLYTGDCPPQGDPLQTATTDAVGEYEFSELSAGAYCVRVDASDPDNADVLPSGRWAYPQLDVDSAGVSVAENETRLFVAFAWDDAQDQ